MRLRSRFLDWIGPTGIYPITDRSLSGLSLADQVAKLGEQGIGLVQLRDKDLGSDDFFREAEQALLVARQRNMKVIINDRVDIAVTLKADGVHLGQDDLPVGAARQLLGDDAVIGLSTHTVPQAQEAVNLPLDYVAIGPVFVTRTKKHPHPVVGLQGVASVRQVIGDLPLVAIGGITRPNRESVRAAGADAVAIISDLWQTQLRKTSQ